MVKVLVVDDSALMRRRIAGILGDAGCSVETAGGGAQALERLVVFDPDVVTLDVTMPDMDGLTCLRRIMVERPKPVVMVSALTAAGADVTLEALRLGAVEAVQKPGGIGALDRIAEDLAATVLAAATSRPRRVQGLRERLRLTRARIAGADFLVEGTAGVGTSAGEALAEERATRAKTTRGGDDPPGIVLIGVSTGGPRTLEDILPILPADFPWPLVVVQHMPANFTGPLARRLDSICALTVVEADRPVALRPGLACIARGGADVELVARGGRLLLQPAPAAAEWSWHPSVDRLVDSARRLLPPGRLIGVLLTGMGNDGAEAMAALHQEGGRTVAEAEESAVIFGMPQELIRRGGAGLVLPSDRIGQQLVRWVG